MLTGSMKQLKMVQNRLTQSKESLEHMTQANNGTFLSHRGLPPLVVGGARSIGESFRPMNPFPDSVHAL